MHDVKELFLKDKASLYVHSAFRLTVKHVHNEVLGTCKLIRYIYILRYIVYNNIHVTQMKTSLKLSVNHLFAA